MNLQQFVKNKYAIGSTHQCQILCFNPFEQIYICTLEKENVVPESDLNIGDQVKVVVKEITDKGLVVRHGRQQGFIQNIHLSNVEFSENIKKSFKTNQQLTVRVWNIDNERGVYFTNKHLLVKLDLFFSSYEDANINEQYVGVVVHIRKNGDVLVIFYGELRGILPNPDAEYFIGQVIITTVIEKTSESLILSLTPPNELDSDDIGINIGDYVDGVVETIQNDSLIVQTKRGVAQIPDAHLSTNLSLNSLLLETYSPGDKLNNLLCIDNQNIPILSIREASQYKNLNMEIGMCDDLKVGSLIRGFYESDDGVTIKLFVPFKPVPRIMTVPRKDFVNDKKFNKFKFQPQQPVLLKVTHVDEETGDIQISGKLTDVCDNYNEKISINNLENYLRNYNRIKHHYSRNNELLKNLYIGQRVQCVIKNKDETGCMVVVNNTPLKGLARVELCPANISIGQELEGVILAINYSKKYVQLVLNEDIQEISPKQDGKNVHFGLTCRAKVLLIDNDFVLALLVDVGGDHQLIYLPTFIHENSCSNKADNYTLLEVIPVIIYRKVGNHVIGLYKNYTTSILRLLKNKGNDLTKGIETLDSVKAPANEVLKLDCTRRISKRNLEKNRDRPSLSSANEEKPTNNSKKKAVQNPPESGFSSMNSFFSSESLPSTPHDSTSDNEINNNEAIPKKKRKRSAAEHSKLAQQKEEEIRRKELEYANLTNDPQNPDQFDRLLLGEPNCSELWAKYIAYYVMQTEFDKARSIAKRALKTIELSESNERCNIWITLLRLENSHGDKATFDDVFEEAARCNDPLVIYLEVIKMLSESHKFDEMKEKIKKARNKFKLELKMWISIANVYFKNGMEAEARDLRSLALRSQCKDKVELIIQFGLMEYRFGHIEVAETLFETFLYRWPKKTNLWKIYIAQIISTGDIDKARRKFNEAIVQDLPIKKKRSLFLMYKDFENKYGTKATFNELIETFGQFETQ